MKYLLFLTSLLLLTSSCLAQKMTHEQEVEAAKKTEVWTPVPPIVTPAVANQAPSDAIVLFDGKDLSAWKHEHGEAAKWKVHEGIITCQPGSGSIRTKQGFQDCQLHIEWKTPIDTTGREGQERGNSGVYFQEKYEVQVLDNYKNPTYPNGQAASIYKQHIPLVNACKAPGEWQTYDIIFTAPRFNTDGTIKKKAYFTVLHNGILVQNHVEVQGPTVWIGHPKYEKHPDKLSIMLQDHGTYISYRNIWIREL